MYVPCRLPTVPLVFLPKGTVIDYESYVSRTVIRQVKSFPPSPPDQKGTSSSPPTRSETPSGTGPSS